MFGNMLCTCEERVGRFVGRSPVKEKVRFCDVGLSSRETKSWINDMRCGVRHESCGEGTRVKVIDEGERER